MCYFKNVNESELSYQLIRFSGGQFGLMTAIVEGKAGHSSAEHAQKV
jgi:hypothetical protein